MAPMSGKDRRSRRSQHPAMSYMAEADHLLTLSAVIRVYHRPHWAFNLRAISTALPLCPASSLSARVYVARHDHKREAKHTTASHQGDACVMRPPGAGLMKFKSAATGINTRQCRIAYCKDR